MNQLELIRKLVNPEVPKVKVEVMAVNAVTKVTTVQNANGDQFTVNYDAATVGDYLYIKGEQVVGVANSLSYTEVEI